MDNGISQYDPSLEANYEVTTSLPSRVDLLNPYWNDPTDDGDVQVRTLPIVLSHSFIVHPLELHRSYSPCSSDALYACRGDVRLGLYL